MTVKVLNRHSLRQELYVCLHREGWYVMGKVIALGREFGSNGRKIAQDLAERLGINYYDKDLITLAAQKKNLPEEKLEEVDEKRESPWQ